MSQVGETFVPVAKGYMGIVIGKKGKNIKQIEQMTQARITSCNGDQSGKGTGFTVTGLKTSVENARVAIEECVRKRQSKESNSAPLASCQTPEASKKMWHDKKTNSTSSAASVSKVISVPTKYVGIILGTRGSNKENIETKSGTQIKVLSCRNAEGRDVDTVQLKIIGPQKNCDGAETRIKLCIAYCKEVMLRNEFGGDTQFAYFAFTDENEKFRLKPYVSSPILNGFVHGERYRIETECDNNGDEDDCQEGDISGETISDLKRHLLRALQNLKSSKEEKRFISDLWCHFGKVLFCGVDEGEIKNTMTAVDLNERIVNIASKDGRVDKGNNTEEFQKSYWRVSFEEGIDPKHINDDQLPKPGDTVCEFFGLKLVSTLWSYDFQFETPSCRPVRLKAWEGLPPDSKQPPAEVKYLLRPVFIKANGDLKAWLCYPSTTVFRANVMSTKSRYDCRMKLRTGFRQVTEENDVFFKEDEVLSDYLSNLRFDKAKHDLELPNENDYKMPEGFACVFYRQAKERMFEATVDGDCFTVTLSNQNTWDSDSSQKRHKEQFSLMVEMNSWSEAMLSPEQHWEPEEIVQKLESYMAFLSSLQTWIILNKEEF